MNRKFTSVIQLAFIVAAAGMFCFATTVRAQDEAAEEAGKSTGIADNPHLRPRPKSTAAAPTQTKLSAKDQTFLSHIAAGGVQVVEDAKLAQAKGDEKVKSAASRIAGERERSNQELVALAKKKGLSLGTGKIKPRDMGKNFDKQYVYTTSHDLQEDVRLLQSAAQSSDDKDIKAWAAKTLPMVKGQLAMVKNAGGKG